MKNLKAFLVLFIISLILLIPQTKAQIVLQVQGVQGDCQIKGYENWIEINQFNFGVERELKESGEKGGTEDINIGIGELQECTISKSMDMASTALMGFGINGNSFGVAQIHFLRTDGSTQNLTPYLQIKMDRAFVKSYSVESRNKRVPLENIALYYNKIHFTYIYSDGKKNEYGWDLVKNITWNGGRRR